MSETYSSKRIAKNTLILYVRMFLSIVIGLYTVRVVWQVLGVDNYGIYNIVGGIVALFAFLNGAMVATSQRFISFELGRGCIDSLKRVFCISLTVHFILAVIILLLAETVGLWFLNTKLNIPTDRMTAANWVYQCSVLAFMVNVVSVPYNACIVAHEHMNIYGYFGIIEVVLKLVIVYLLLVIPFDKLIAYALLTLSVSLFMRVLYGWYCKRHFEECSFQYTRDSRLIKEMFSFAGWSFVGNMGFAVRNQGMDIILNLFFNVAVNAAKGIANNVGGVIYGFTSNFQMAMNPQITKLYAIGDKSTLMQLVFRGCKFSTLLLFLFILPLIVAGYEVLTLWIGDVAPYTVGFMRLILLMYILEALAGPLITVLQATGKIKLFQISISILMFSSLPFSWVWLKLDANPYIVIYVGIITAVIALGLRLWLMHRQVGAFTYREFVVKVLLPLALTGLVAGAVVWWIFRFYSHSWIGIISYGITSVVVVGLIAFVIGLNPKERKFVVDSAKKVISRFI